MQPSPSRESSPVSTHQMDETKMHKRLPGTQLARKDVKNARESEPVNPQTYFFSYYFWREAEKNRKGSGKLTKIIIHTNYFNLA